MTGRTEIYCFAHAGASMLGTAEWQVQLGDSIVLKGLAYPGHGHRFCEPLEASIEAIADGLVRTLPSFDPCWTVFFGHSMGSLVAYEVCRQLYARRQPLPSRLFLSGRGAPYGPRKGIAPDLLPDAELLEYLRALGGTPEAVLADAEMCALLLPVARADFAACRRYAPVLTVPLPVELFVYAGEHDDLGADELDAWSGCTTSGCTYRRFAGGHFYFDVSTSAFLGALSTDVTSPVPANSGCSVRA